jgi:Domain of unknown function (DUF5658)
MDHPVGVVTAERRRQSDRRAHPTTFRSALRFRGRRRECRRAGEADRAYVDCPSQRVTLLLFFVVGASILDALCTLLFIQSGGDEANPLMSLVLSHGETPFVGIKMAATVIGAWFLAAHQYFPLAFKGLHALAAGYGALLFTHAVILLS